MTLHILICMNFKKLALFGVIALVVLGCVIAAGCTSTQTPQTVTGEKIAGIWAGTDNFNGEKTTTIIKEDGSGVFISVGTNNIPERYFLNWKKNTNGTYALDFANGDKRTYSVDATGTILTSSSGNIKYKHFMDNLVPGVWYNKERNVLVLMNADGTGFWNDDTGLTSFTWDKVSDGKYATHNYNGATAGKTFEWTYDKATDVLTDSVGDKFIHPTESIENRITITK